VPVYLTATPANLKSITVQRQLISHSLYKYATVRVRFKRWRSSWLPPGQT